MFWEELTPFHYILQSAIVKLAGTVNW